MNDKLKENEICMLEPDSCKACGWKPVVQNNENQEISISNCWLVMPIPNSPIWLFICPKCNVVTANKNCVENAEKMKKWKETRSPILGPKSPITLPGLGNIGRN